MSDSDSDSSLLSISSGSSSSDSDEEMMLPKPMASPLGNGKLPNSATAPQELGGEKNMSTSKIPGVDKSEDSDLPIVRESQPQPPPMDAVSDDDTRSVDSSNNGNERDSDDQVSEDGSENESVEEHLSDMGSNTNGSATSTPVKSKPVTPSKPRMGIQPRVKWKREPEVIPPYECSLENEDRGAKELELVDAELAKTRVRPSECEEKDVDPSFNEPSTPGNEDVLRNLSNFYFCDENGKAIRLEEVLEKKPEERGRVMGFGTILQPLLAADRSATIKEYDQRLQKYIKVQLDKAEVRPELDAKEKEDLTDAVESGFTWPKSSKHARVVLRDIEDWCFDYEFGNPTLWVITREAWYKIAGPLSGLLPHASYRPYFNSTRKLFESCFRVAFLLQQSATLPKPLAYRVILAQVAALSSSPAGLARYPIDQQFLVEHMPFLKNQMSNLGDDVALKLGKSFFKNLGNMRKTYEKHQEAAQKRKAAQEKRLLEQEHRRLEKKLKLAQDKQQKKETRELIRKEAMERRKRLKKYPIDDLDRLKERQEAGFPIPERPHPTGRLKMGNSDVRADVFGDIVMAWVVLLQFFRVDITACKYELKSLHNEAAVSENNQVSLEDLCEVLCSTDSSNVILHEIFLALLAPVWKLKHDENRIEQSKGHFDRIENGDNVKSQNGTEMELISPSYGICSNALIFPLTYMTWQEALSEMMARDVGMDTPVGWEPLSGCELVWQRVAKHPLAAPFAAPVDTTVIYDYLDTINQPMDLQTIKSRLISGFYYDLPKNIGDEMSKNEKESMKGSSHEKFAHDMRLIFDNAVQYNGEDSELGRSAQVLGDLFEQDYRDMVLKRLKRSQDREQEECRMSRLLSDQSGAKSITFQDYNKITLRDVVLGLAIREMHQLPLSFKVSALTWVISAFIQTSAAKDIIETNNTHIQQLNQVHREEDKLLGMKLKEYEKRVDECAGRLSKMSYEKTVLIDDILEDKHPEMYKVKQELDESTEVYERERRVLRQELHRKRRNELSLISYREIPIGFDRYRNRYWMFEVDTAHRLFFEDAKTGHFDLYRDSKEIKDMLKWLDVKGCNEYALKCALEEREYLWHKSVSSVKEQSDEETIEKSVAGLACRPLVDPSGNSVEILPPYGGTAAHPFLEEFRMPIMAKVQTADRSNSVDLSRLVGALIERLNVTFLRKGDARNSGNESSFPKGDRTVSRYGSELLDLESQLFNRCREFPILLSRWQLKRRQWRITTKNSKSCSAIYILVRIFLKEGINENALQDLMDPMERSAWQQLRPQPNQTAVPQVGDSVIYFEEGHYLAQEEDKVSRSKTFIWDNDASRGGSESSKSSLGVKSNAKVVVCCRVNDISYHHGSGDPYCRVHLTKSSLPSSWQRPIGGGSSSSRFVDFLSPHQRLNRALKNIMVEHLLPLEEAAPFLNPVSVTEFPDYLDVIERPMDLSLVKGKVEDNTYVSVDSFLFDIELIRSNCQQYCETRFPTLPPMAEHVYDIAMLQARKLEKRLQKTAAHPVDDSKLEEMGADTAPKVVVLRLENRLPEFLVNTKKYSEDFLQRKWISGMPFRVMFRKLDGAPDSYYKGIVTGSMPYLHDDHDDPKRCLVPWESLMIEWDPSEGSSANDGRINPWEIEPLN